jgi:hypothetical protein
MRTGTLIACGCATLALALAGCGGGSSSSHVSTPTATTPPSTSTAAPASTATATTPTATTTQTSPAPATISQVEAKAAARVAASQGVVRASTSLPPGQWDAHCTATGGRDRAGTWSCQVTSLNGQCSGSLTAYAAARDVARARNVQVACAR